MVGGKKVYGGEISPVVMSVPLSIFWPFTMNCGGEGVHCNEQNSLMNNLYVIQTSVFMLYLNGMFHLNSKCKKA